MNLVDLTRVPILSNITKLHANSFSATKKVIISNAKCLYPLTPSTVCSTSIPIELKTLLLSIKIFNMVPGTAQSYFALLSCHNIFFVEPLKGTIFIQLFTFNISICWIEVQWQKNLIYFRPLINIIFLHTVIFLLCYQCCLSANFYCKGLGQFQYHCHLSKWIH